MHVINITVTLQQRKIKREIHFCVGKPLKIFVLFRQQIDILRQNLSRFRVRHLQV